MRLQSIKGYFTVFLVSAMLLPACASAQIYKWVDRDGKVQYGDRPPANQNAAASLAARSNSQANGPAPVAWEEKDREFRRRRIERQMRDEKTDAQTPGQQICQTARRRLQMLDGRVVYRLDDKGERVYMEDAERHAIERKAQQDISTYCSP